MTHSLREQWRRFASRPAGRRFQMRYRARREKPAGRTRKVVIIGLGAVLMLVGAIMLVLPGPGALVLIAGAALVGEESLVAARVLDRCDLWIARRIRRFQAWRAARTPRS